MPDFAVVIPTYRRPEYLAQAVESVLAQSLPPAEVIIVGDGPESTIPDDLRHGPVQVIEQPHRGVAMARNTGLAAAGSKWVCFLDDDDLWHPDRLAHTAAYLAEHPECDALTTPSWYFARQPGPGTDLVATDLAGCMEQAERVAPTIDVSYLDIQGRSYELLLERNRGNISGATVRRRTLEQAGGFPADFTCGEDWLMYINVARYTEWHYLDERLSFVRRHDGNNTTSNPTNGLMAIRAIRHAWADDDHPVPAHRDLAGYGPDYRWMLQDALWGSVRRRQFAIAWETAREGMPLLARTRDRAYALVPPQITWRIEHWVADRRARRPRR
jgi:glycosyltransferase involved in cell wall biosynthesis